MFKAQKDSKDITKIVHVTSVVQPYFYKATRIFFVRKDYFKDILTNFLGLEHISCVAVYRGSESFRISSKIS